MSFMISRKIDKLFHAVISGSLTASGFSVIKEKTAWGWHNECIWVLTVRAVGYDYATITGWPSSSLKVELGIYYLYLPNISTLTPDNKGFLYPKTYNCNRRALLFCSYDQMNYTNNVTINRERTRRDIWWVEPDGSNLDDVILDINNCFLKYGTKWFIEKSNKEITLLEAEHLNGLSFDEIEYN